MVLRWIGIYDLGGVGMAMRKSKIAFKFACERLGTAVFFWTFTFRDCLDVKEARKQWNTFLTRLRKQYPNFHGVRIFEMHDHHGVHVHLLTTRWISVVDLRAIIASARKTSWGRIHVVRARPGISSYLAKYLSKDRPACLKGWRLWAGFGRWEWTRVKDVVFESTSSQIYRACKEAYKWEGNSRFFQRMRFVFALEVRTICNGWQPGYGPYGKPLDVFARRVAWNRADRPLLASDQEPVRQALFLSLGARLKVTFGCLPIFYGEYWLLIIPNGLW
jgi:hypothetical protein